MTGKAKAGRKTILNQQLSDIICKGIEAGLTHKQAAAFAGISHKTLWEWSKKGERQKSGVYTEFSIALKKSQLQARLTHLSKIDAAGDGGKTFEEETVTEKTEIDAFGNERVVAREIRKTKKVAMPQWQASAWILERRFREEFGRNAKPVSPEEKDSFDTWIDALNEAEEQFGDMEYPEEGNVEE